MSTVSHSCQKIPLNTAPLSCISTALSCGGKMKGEDGVVINSWDHKSSMCPELQKQVCLSGCITITWTWTKVWAFKRFCYLSLDLKDPGNCQECLYCLSGLIMYHSTWTSRIILLWCFIHPHLYCRGMKCTLLSILIRTDQHPHLKCHFLRVAMATGCVTSTVGFMSCREY